MRFKKRGQVAIEYMTIFGFAIVVLIALIFLSMHYSRQTEDTIILNQVDRLARDIVDSAESVYNFGEPSKKTIKAYIPDKVELINISINEVLFKIRTEQGTSDIGYTSPVNLSGSIINTPGIHYISIEAKSGYVWINST